MTTNEKDEYLEVPISSISEQALDALIDEFILREGTDYGHSEQTLAEKRARILKLIASKRAKVTYSLLEETTSLIVND